MKKSMAGRVVFVGAGPGATDLLTIAGAKAIGMADLVLYAGSLVHPSVIALAKSGAEKRNSASMTLAECVELMRESVEKGKLVARVHTGDPSIFGTLAEQTRELDRLGISWGVIPGVTAACAAAACAGVSFTRPELAQGLIIARQEGRTRTHPGMELDALAANGLPMAIYLSGGLAKEVRTALLKALSPETPILCVQRAGWPEGKVVWTTLAKLEECVQLEKLHEQTVFIVLPAHGANAATSSRLYAEDFSHGYRKNSS